HVLVNGKKVDIPSYLVKAGDVITVRSKSNDYLKTVMSMIDLSCAPAWVTVDKDALKITFDRVPEREELDPEIKEQLVIEYYSK
ncbi:30S ribosomal protein S4, partial [bacterium]|nr:30S ribosomal protein S4 [bacterium]